ncbi:hypothetical protein, partial [Micromonospora aurantiaca (nom. illeg.)]|uniref:hypothetical protein n=1 Tax=Micromonospora aurantiaca (nom. illeg.) TaxID=47850 RepID=UPI00380F0D76
RPAQGQTRHDRAVGGHRASSRNRAVTARACRLVAHSTCQQGYGVSRAHHAHPLTPRYAAPRRPTLPSQIA